MRIIITFCVSLKHRYFSILLNYWSLDRGNNHCLLLFNTKRILNLIPYRFHTNVFICWTLPSHRFSMESSPSQTWRHLKLLICINEQELREQDPVVGYTKEHVEETSSLGIKENANDISAPTDNFSNIKIQSSNTEDVILKFLVINDTEIQIQSANDSYIINVPKSLDYCPIRKLMDFFTNHDS